MQRMRKAESHTIMQGPLKQSKANFWFIQALHSNGLVW